MIPQRRFLETAAHRRHAALVAVGRIVLAIVAMLGLYFLLPFERAASVTHVWLVVAGAVIVLAVVSALQLRAVAHAEFPTIRGGEALAVSLVLLLVSFAGIYIGLSSNDVGAFSEPLDQIGALYFAMTTLTTIGYGDISPISDGARIVVMVQMVVDVIVLGVFIKLVANTVKDRLSTDLTAPDATAPDPTGSADDLR